MKTYLRLLLATSLFSVASCFAQEEITIKLDVKLISAANGEAKQPPELKDILPILTKNLRFNVFELLDSKVFMAKNNAELSLKKQVKLKIDKVEGDKLTVIVFHKKKQVLKTVLIPAPGKPSIIGGFPEKDKVLILSLLMQ